MIGEYKLHSQGEFVTGEFGEFKPIMKKVDQFCTEYSEFTSGLVKYTNIPQGTKVRLTLEIIE